MKTIWKYKVNIEAFQEIEMAQDAQILTLHKQGNRHDDDVSVWCLVDTDKPQITRAFVLTETGQEVPENSEYVGTIWMMNGAYVLHLLEVQKG